MNPIVAQRQLLREIPDEVLQFQPQARYESLPAEPMYCKACLARRHPRRLAAAQKVALGRPSNVHRSNPFPRLKAEDCSPIARTSVTDPESPARNHCTAWAVCHTNDTAPSPIAVR